MPSMLGPAEENCPGPTASDIIEGIESVRWARLMWSTLNDRPNDSRPNLGGRLLSKTVGSLCPMRYIALMAALNSAMRLERPLPSVVTTSLMHT